jgi:hypothetical protein
VKVLAVTVVVVPDGVLRFGQLSDEGLTAAATIGGGNAPGPGEEQRLPICTPKELEHQSEATGAGGGTFVLTPCGPESTPPQEEKPSSMAASSPLRRRRTGFALMHKVIRRGIDMTWNAFQ